MVLFCSLLVLPEQGTGSRQIFPRMLQYEAKKSRSSLRNGKVRASWMETYITLWLGSPIRPNKLFPGSQQRILPSSAAYSMGDEGSNAASFKPTNTCLEYHKPLMSSGMRPINETDGTRLYLVKSWSSTFQPTPKPSIPFSGCNWEAWLSHFQVMCVAKTHKGTNISF